MPQTVNPVATAVIIAFVALILLARFVRRKPPAGASGSGDPTVVWMHGDTGQRHDSPADGPVREAMHSSPAERDDPGQPDNAAGGSADTGSGDAGGSDSGGGSND